MKRERRLTLICPNCPEGKKKERDDSKFSKFPSFTPHHIKRDTTTITAVGQLALAVQKIRSIHAFFPQKKSQKENRGLFKAFPIIALLAKFSPP